MKVELTLNEIRLIRFALSQVKIGRNAALFTPAAFGIVSKFDSIITAAECEEGKKYLED